MKKILLLSAFVLTCTFTFAQKINGVVKGNLQDSASKSPLPDATISVMSGQDSSLVSFTLTSNSGYFEIKNLEAGSYYLIVSYQGFETLKRSFDISNENKVADLQDVKMHQAYKTLDEVVVNDVAPIRVKGDTIAYNANSFKTKPNATVEDLLKKLPGVQVERDGTVKAQGENVQKVYVDGKEFFGTDPKMATKNLSADMIDQVEVYDDMSEQAKFNGIDDGSRSKAINLKLKKDKKRGTFGRLTAGYGTDDRYNANLRTNFFKGATQVTVLASGNNNNNQNFGSTDFLGMGGMSMGSGGMVMGGGRGIMMGGGMGGGSFGAGNSGNGITSSYSLGANYNDTWSKAIDLSSSYNFNHSGNINLRDVYRQNIIPGFNRIDDQSSISDNNNDAHRMNLRLNYTINDKNSLILSSNLSFQNSNNERNDTTAQFSLANDVLTKLTEIRSKYLNTGEGLNWNNNITWRKKFAKAGRTFSMNFTNSLNNGERNGFTEWLQSNFNTSGAKVKDSTINQKNINNNNNSSYNINLSYTEPIGRDKIVEMNYSYNNNDYSTERETFDYNELTKRYDLDNELLTNLFDNFNESHRIGTNFRTVKKKYNYQLGVAAQRTLLKSKDLSKNMNINQVYTNFFPTAVFNYQFARSKNLRFNYRGRTNQPSASQLQPFLDITNPNYLRQGNPNLNQEYNSNFSLNYSAFDPMRFRNFFAYINFSNTYNKIVNSTTILDAFGKQLTMPVNTDGVFNVMGNVNFGLPIKKMKGGNFNATTRVNYNREASFINGAKNFTNSLTLGEDLRLNYNYKDKLDVGISAGINYTSAKYTLQKSQNTSYLTHTYSADITYTLPKGFLLATDADYYSNTGGTESFNQSFLMWNASVGKQLFKNKRGEVKLSVFDILNQNISVTRNVDANYIEDVQTNVLQRYFMLTFTYNINRMAGKAIPASGGRPGGNRTIIMQ